MRRLTWLFVAWLAFSFETTAQQPNPSFAQAGYVGKDELSKLTYGPAIKDLALATHVPAPRVRVGEPLWAYFVVKNLGEQMQGLDMRFDFVIGRTHQVNSGWFSIKPLTDGARLGALQRASVWECGGGPLVDVAAKGYYVGAIDLNAWGKLTPGDYEVSWRSTEHVSNTVRVTILPGPEPQPKERTPRYWTLWELRRGGQPVEGQPAKSTKPESWSLPAMRPWFASDFSAALGSGIGDRHIVDLEKLPTSDDLLSVSADWKLGDKIDRVTLRLTPKQANVPLSLEKLHVYLLADTPGRSSRRPQEGRSDGAVYATRVTPHTIEMDIPSYWRLPPDKRYQAASAIPAALLVTSESLRPPRRNRQSVERVETRRIREANAPKIWNGLLRTTIQNVTWLDEPPEWTADQIFQDSRRPGAEQTARPGASRQRAI
jgi:hypothetical protein